MYWMNESRTCHVTAAVVIGTAVAGRASSGGGEGSGTAGPGAVGPPGVAGVVPPATGRCGAGADATDARTVSEPSVRRVSGRTPSARRTIVAAVLVSTS